MRTRIAAFALLSGVMTAGSTAAVTLPAAAATAPNVARTCQTPTAPGKMTCFALRRTDTPTMHAAADASPPPGYGPGDLRDAYKLPTTGGTGATVAIVDAYDDPTAESDLAVYRKQYGLPACTTANGCFRKVNQDGAASPLPEPDEGWAGEISLDLDMVSAICAKCNILLVEADTNDGLDLFSAVNTAVALGARYVSNSWGSSEYQNQTSIGAQYLDHPGVVITASTGDDGYGASFPATSRYVTAVGGTSLTRASNARGWTESAWEGAGSGCSAYDVKPAWQGTTGTCKARAAADVAAVADAETGVAVYQTFGDSGWGVAGGTSASAPIVASVYALAGNPGKNDYPAAYPYSHKANLFDVTTGTNGSCGAAMCNSGTGWDGPTGLGTPNGTAAFVASASSSVKVTSPGAQTGRTGTAVKLTLMASGGSGTYTWSATGLPAGLTIASRTGVISGKPTRVGSSTVRVTATSGKTSASASFGWKISAPPKGPVKTTSVDAPPAQAAEASLPITGFDLPAALVVSILLLLCGAALVGTGSGRDERPETWGGSVTHRRRLRVPPVVRRARTLRGYRGSTPMRSSVPAARRTRAGLAAGPQSERRQRTVRRRLALG